MLQRAGMIAPDGRCKTMDAAADGYVRAQTCKAMYLMPANMQGMHVCSSLHVILNIFTSSSTVHYILTSCVNKATLYHADVQCRTRSNQRLSAWSYVALVTNTNMINNQISQQ